MIDIKWFEKSIFENRKKFDYFAKMIFPGYQKNVIRIIKKMNFLNYGAATVGNTGSV